MTDTLLFKKTLRQREACALMNRTDHTLLYGGSRSGKSFIIVRNIILRALKTESRHLMARYRFNHAKTSLWYDTVPKVFKLCFPGLKYKENKSDWFISVPTRNGGASQIWLGGLDDKQRTEKVLGNEYSTIFINEASQVSYDSVNTLRTRLAENSGLQLREYIDLNPSGKKHWSYQEFIEKVIPGTKEPSLLESGFLVMNPTDNLDNLPAKYIKILEALPKRQRQRFLEGLFLADVEGALWTDQMVSDALTKPAADLMRTVIAVDPAVTHTADSDETGIVVCALDENREGVVREDLSIKASTATWAQRVVNAYHAYEANYVVAEVNNGGDLVRDVLKSIDKTVKIKLVRAAVGKFARAEPISELYELGKVSHAKVLPELEAQLTEYVPLNAKKSPDRLDALVWGLTELMLQGPKQVHAG